MQPVTYLGMSVFEWMLLLGGVAIGRFLGIRRAERGRARFDMRRVWDGRDLWRRR
jgi:hypothetical protein